MRYEDPFGRFTIYLPDGWGHDPVSSDITTTWFRHWSKREGTVIVSLIPTRAPSTDNDELWRGAIEASEPLSAPSLRACGSGSAIRAAMANDEGVIYNFLALRGARLDLVAHHRFEDARPDPLSTDPLRSICDRAVIEANRAEPIETSYGEVAGLVARADAEFRAGQSVQALESARRAVDLARGLDGAALLGHDPTPAVVIAIELSHALALVGSLTRDLALLGQAESVGWRARTQADTIDGAAPAAVAEAIGSIIKGAQLPQLELVQPPHWLTPDVGPGLAAVRGLGFHQMGHRLLEEREYARAGDWLSQGIAEFAASLASTPDQSPGEWRDNLLGLLVTDTGWLAVSSIFANDSRDALALTRQGLAAAREFKSRPSGDGASATALTRIALLRHIQQLTRQNNERSLVYASQLLREVDAGPSTGDTATDADVAVLKGLVNWQLGNPREGLGAIDAALLALSSSDGAAGEPLHELRRVRARLLLALGDPAAARVGADDAVEAAPGSGPAARLAQAEDFLVAAEAALAAGDIAQARQGAARVLNAVMFDAPASHTVNYALEVARASLDNTDEAAVADLLTARIAVLELMELAAGGADAVDFRDAPVARRVYETLIDWYLAKAWPLPAIEVADRSRARGIYAKLAPRPMSGTAAQSPATFEVSPEKLGEAARWIIDRANQQLAAAGVPPPLPMEQIAELSQQIRGSVLVLQPIGERLGLLLLRGTDRPPGLGRSPVPLRELQLALLQVQQGLGAMSMRGRGSPAGAELAMSDGPTQPDLTGPLDVLWSGIYEPIERLLEPEEPLHISPYRDLLVVPFGLLSARGDHTVLWDRHPVSVVPSLGLLATMRARGRWALERSDHAVVVGDPTVATTDQDFRPLPQARQEASEVRDALRTFGLDPASISLRVGLQADEGSLREELPGAKLAHLACHGQATEPAELSRLYLAGSTERDGLVTAYEVAAMALPDSLVFLSACDSGGGRATTDGVLSLAGAFLTAGARAVVASQWQVSDAATRTLARHFYGSLLGDRGLDVAASLRIAALATRDELAHGLVRETDGTATDPGPGSWAPFFVAGDPEIVAAPAAL